MVAVDKDLFPADEPPSDINFGKIYVRTPRCADTDKPTNPALIYSTLSDR